MIALGLSIVVSTLLFSCFRLFPRFNVRLEDAVVINYIVAGTLAVLLAGPSHALGRVPEPSSLAGVVMGLSFLYMFNKIGQCTQQLGLGVVAIATKMSMVLPMSVFMLFDPTDPFTWQKATAVVLAFPAVWLASSPRRSADGPAIDGADFRLDGTWTLPAIVFFGSGLIDLGFGWFSSESHMSCDADRLTFAAVPFTVAALIGLLRWAFVPSAKPVLSRATVLGGILLGTINVGSLFFLLSAYQSMPFPRSAIVPSNNLGIVLATALAGIAFFKERPDGRNILGWALATTALVLLLLPN
jgi:uncharacterized membrane protein